MASRIDLNARARDLFATTLRQHGLTVDVPVRGDFLVRDAARTWRLTIRAVQNRNYSYVRKRVWRTLDGQLLGFATFDDRAGTVRLYVIPAPAWENPGPTLKRVLKSRDYDQPGQTSEPEWGIDSRHDLLTPFLLDAVLTPQGFRFPDPASI